MIKVDETATGEYENQVQIVDEALSKLEDYHNELTNIMAIGKWEGQSHDVCSNVIVAVKEYLDKLEEDFKTLKENVNTLQTNVDEFDVKSPSVQILKR